MGLVSREAAAITFTARSSLAMKPQAKSLSAARLRSLSSVTRLPRQSVHMIHRFRRRLRPRALLAADQFESPRDLQHAQVIKAMPGDLQPDRQARAGVAAVDRRRGLLGHVEGHREAD